MYLMFLTLITLYVVITEPTIVTKQCSVNGTTVIKELEKNNGGGKSTAANRVLELSRLLETIIKCGQQKDREMESQIQQKDDEINFLRKEIAANKPNYPINAQFPSANPHENSFPTQYQDMTIMLVFFLI